MEIAHISNLPEFGMDDPGFILNSLDEMSAISFAASFGESFNHPLSHSMFDPKPSREASHAGINRPIKTNSWDFTKADHLSNGQTNSYPNQVSFTNSNYGTQVCSVKPKEEALSSPSDIMASQGTFGNQNYVLKACQGAKRTRTDNGFSSNQDHILAERKRREMLSQRFIALSAMVPGLKKMDKASVLGDAIKYLKQLQERVKTLEEQARKRSVESVVLMKKYEVHAADGDGSSSDENFSGGAYEEPLPEVEARIYDKTVLIRVHCERRKGVLEKTVAEIEKLDLSIVNSSVLTFGSLALDITIIAEMNAEFTMTVKDLVKHLHASLKMFM